MKYFRKIKIVMLVALIGSGLSGSLTACVYDADGWHAGNEMFGANP
jgi:hypothetical protein